MIAPILPRQGDERPKAFVSLQPVSRPSVSTSQEKRDWQEIQVIFKKPDGDMALLQIIYSREWLQSRKVTVGGPIQLNIPKYKIRGEGKVRAIRPSAEIPNGEGLVTACVHLRPEPEDAGLPPLKERVWQQLHVQVADLKGNHVYMVILHSKEWMQQHGMVGKGKLFVDMPERGVRGEGHLTLVEPSPIISDGEGRIMTFAQTNRPLKFEPKKPSQIGIRTYFGERLPPAGHEWIQISPSGDGGATSDLRLVRSKEWMETNWHIVEELQKNELLSYKVDELRLVHVSVEVQDHQKVHVAFFWPEQWVVAYALAVGEPVWLMPGRDHLFGEGEVTAISPAPYAPGEDEPHGMISISGKRGDSTKGMIESMEVGDYVATYTHEERGDRMPIDDTQGKWVARQRIRLHLDKEEGAHSSIVLLRKTEWVRSENIAVGGCVFLNMPEMGCVGHARVEVIEPCLVFLRWGNSSIRMVTGTFKHSEGWCGDLKLKGESKPIGVTPLHPFWSEDRQDWVSVGELRPGETVKTLKGTTTVESYTMCDKPEPTFNMEVEGDHVYRVGEQGILVHNASDPCSTVKLTPGTAMWDRSKSVTVVDRRDYTDTNSTKCITPCPTTPSVSTNVVVQAWALFNQANPTIGEGSGTDIPARRWSRCVVGMDKDDAGHVIGNALGGSGKLADGNIFPQVLGINRGIYNKQEGKVRDAIKNSCRVCIHIQFNYPQEGAHIGRPQQQNGIIYDVYVNYVKNPKAPIDFSNPNFNN